MVIEQQAETEDGTRNHQIVLGANAAQRKLLMSLARFFVFVAGRRSGKTEAVAWSIYLKAMSRGGRDIAYIAPTYHQARQIMYRRLRAIIPRQYFLKCYATGPPRFILKNGTTIFLYGGQAAENIRGMGFDHVYFDEFADIPEHVFPEIIRPTLAETLGGATFIGTPKGRSNALFDVWTAAGRLDGWDRVECTTAESGNVPPEEIELAQATMDPKIFRQEFEASFETFAGMVYYEFSNTSITDIGFNPSNPILMAWDFNASVKPMAVNILQETAVGSDDWIVVKDFNFNMTNTDEMSQSIELCHKKHNFKQSVTVTGDYAGRRRSSQATISDYQIIEKYFKNTGPRYRTKWRPTLHIRDRVAATNAMFDKGRKRKPTDRGFKRLRISRDCVKLIKDLDFTEWKVNGVGLDDRDPERTHPSDALSYFCYNFYPVDRKERVTGVY